MYKIQLTPRKTTCDSWLLNSISSLQTPTAPTQLEMIGTGNSKWHAYLQIAVAWAAGKEGKVPSSSFIQRRQSVPFRAK